LITAWAAELRNAGLEGGMDELRARAYLDLLLGKDSRPRHGNAEGGGDGGSGGQGPGDSDGPPPSPAPGGFAGRDTLPVPCDEARKMPAARRRARDRGAKR